jgi:hypothetical protein
MFVAVAGTVAKTDIHGSAATGTAGMKYTPCYPPGGDRRRHATRRRHRGWRVARGRIEVPEGWVHERGSPRTLPYKGAG